MHAITAPPPVTPADRLGFTLFVAIVAHLVVILGVVFVPEDRPVNRSNTLDIVLVQQRSEEAPEDADFLAQANQDGGGDTFETVRPATPLAAPFTSREPDIAVASLPARPVERVVTDSLKSEQPEPVPTSTPAQVASARTVLTQTARPTEHRVVSAPSAESIQPRVAEPVADPDERMTSDKKPVPNPNEQPKKTAIAEPEPEEKVPPQPTQSVSAATLINRSLAMASLNAEIDRRLEAYAKRPRRKWITARTKEHKYAAYMEAWRLKVERIGNLNYPDEARRRNLSGSLLLDVSINSDGTIAEIIVRRSSGQRVLDDAAVRIVKLAAPFAKFPKSIAEETDILHIERTWVFLTGDQFMSN